MLNTYVKNRGATQMLIRNNNTNKFNEIQWDADYDGESAHISLNSTINGRTNHYNIELDNEDLANLLNIPSVNIPIDKRLKMDLRGYNQDMYRIELPKRTNTIENLIESMREPSGYLSSPLPNEELLVPITLNEKSSPRKQKKTHKTYKVYKKRKSSASKTKTSSKTKYQRL